tara:strand:+ start:3791 stop:4150 length:360 start_codon:yes stop_codon:yes gene_type:complete
MKNFKIYITFVLTTCFCLGGDLRYSSQLDTIKEVLSGAVVTDHINYPSLVKDYSISGVSVVEFNADKKGNISGIQIVKSLGKPFDPGIYEGLEAFNTTKLLENNVSNGFRYRLPVLFKN